jgi:hypothetical protein
MMAPSLRTALATPAFVLGLVTLAVHLLFNGGYGYFRDELYFIVCGWHPAWGYVDQPPLVPLLAAGSYALFGKYLILFRLPAALTMAVTVGLTAEFAKALGGGRFAQWLAGLCVLGAPFYLLMGLLVFTDMFQPMTWLLCAWCVVRLVQTGDERWWLGFGATVGFALLSKYMILFFAAGVAVGIIATPLRRSLLKPWIYAGAALALVIAAPNLWWQAAHGWPFIELGSAGAGGKNLALSPLSYFLQQLLLIGPLAAPVWLAGLGSFAIAPRHPAYRAFAIAYAVMFVLFVILHGKAYYIASAHPILLAGGAVFLEGKMVAAWVRVVALTLLAAASALFAPLSLPILPVDKFIAFSDAIGLGPKVTASEYSKLGKLPQYYADMFGWPQMAKKVAAVYWALPPADRAKAMFFGHNYGEAAAIDVFGRPLGLPAAVSGHNNYFLWGLHGHDGSVVIQIGGDPDAYAHEFRNVTVAGRIDSPYAMPYEADAPIYVLRGLKLPLAQAWRASRHYE